PALKRAPRPQRGRHQLVIDLDQAIGSPVLVALAAEPGHQLAYPDLAPDHPINRAAGQHLLGAARPVPGVDPAAAALLEPRRAKPAQLVDIADADRHLQQMQWCRIERAVRHQPAFASVSAISSAPSSTGSPAA